MKINYGSMLRKNKTKLLAFSLSASFFLCFYQYFFNTVGTNERKLFDSSVRYIYVPSLQKGLTNQKLQMLQVVRLAKILDRTLIIPGLNDFLPSTAVVTKGVTVCQDEILCQIVSFSSVFSVSKFARDLQFHLNVSSTDISELPTYWRQEWTIGEIMIQKKLKKQKDKETSLFQRLGTVAHAKVIILNGLVASLPLLRSRVTCTNLTAQEVDAKIMSSFHLNDFLSRRLQRSSLTSNAIFSECSHEVKFTLTLHVRAEPDMYRLCMDSCLTAEQMVSSAAEYFDFYRNNSIILVLAGNMIGNMSLKYDVVSHLERLGWCASKVAAFIKKDDLLDIQQGAIDYEVGIRSSFFVGLRLSTFSSELFKARSVLDKPSWEFGKSGVIPLSPKLL